MHPMDRRLRPLSAGMERRSFLKVGAAAGAALIVEFRFLATAEAADGLRPQRLPPGRPPTTP